MKPFTINELTYDRNQVLFLKETVSSLGASYLSNGQSTMAITLGEVAILLTHIASEMEDE